MSGEERDSPFTWEAAQNAKGYFQIRFKMKLPILQVYTDEEKTKMIKEQLEVAKNAVEKAGFHVQPEEPLKTK